MSLTKHLLQAQSGYRLQPNQLMNDLTRCAAGPHFLGGFGKAARAQLATQGSGLSLSRLASMSLN